MVRLHAGRALGVSSQRAKPSRGPEHDEHGALPPEHHGLVAVDPVHLPHRRHRDVQAALVDTEEIQRLAGDRDIAALARQWGLGIVPGPRFEGGQGRAFDDHHIDADLRDLETHGRELLRRDGRRHDASDLRHGGGFGTDGQQRSGRDMPGSNWHTYLYDPDGQSNELYYGIEQIGWNGHSKPRAMYDRGFDKPPDLPQISELEEVEQARARGPSDGRHCGDDDRGRTAVTQRSPQNTRSSQRSSSTRGSAGSACSAVDVVVTGSDSVETLH